MLRSEPGSHTIASHIESGHNPQALEKYYQDEIITRSNSWFHSLPEKQQQTIEADVAEKWKQVRLARLQDPVAKKELKKVIKELYKELDEATKDKPYRLIIQIISRSIVGRAFSLEFKRQLKDIYSGTPSRPEDVKELFKIRGDMIIYMAADHIDKTEESIEGLKSKYDLLKARFGDRDIRKLPLTEDEYKDYDMYYRLWPIFETSQDL